MEITQCLQNCVLCVDYSSIGVSTSSETDIATTAIRFLELLKEAEVI